MLCTGNAAAGSEGKLVYASTNGGLTFRKVGPAPLNGDGGTLATPPGRPLIVTLATSSAASMLDRSVNGGRTWTQTMYVDNGIGWRDLAYVTSTTGWIIHGSAGFPAYAALMRTVNSGASWKTVPIP